MTFVGNHAFLARVVKTVGGELGLRDRNIYCDWPIYRVTWGGIWQAVRLREFLYRDATVWLERKRIVFDQIPSKRGSSQYIGVYRPAGRHRWVARIFADGKTRHIASCHSEEEAALAYDAAARAYYGNSAMQNFPAQGSTTLARGAL